MQIELLISIICFDLVGRLCHRRGVHLVNGSCINCLLLSYIPVLSRAVAVISTDGLSYAPSSIHVKVMLSWFNVLRLL